MGLYVPVHRVSPADKQIQPDRLALVQLDVLDPHLPAVTARGHLVPLPGFQALHSVAPGQCGARPRGDGRADRRSTSYERGTGDLGKGRTGRETRCVGYARGAV
jgi:hypothetical protein